jgi:hypothetical protein
MHASERSRRDRIIGRPHLAGLFLGLDVVARGSGGDFTSFTTLIHARCGQWPGRSGYSWLPVLRRAGMPGCRNLKRENGAGPPTSFKAGTAGGRRRISAPVERCQTNPLFEQLKADVQEGVAAGDRGDVFDEAEVWEYVDARSMKSKATLCGRIPAAGIWNATRSRESHVPSTQPYGDGRRASRSRATNASLWSSLRSRLCARPRSVPHFRSRETRAAFLRPRS